MWEVIFKARPFPYKDVWVVIVECNLLFNFYRVHKYLYIHLQLRKLVPKSAGVYVMSSYKEKVMKEKVFYVVNDRDRNRETKRERRFLNLWNFERSTRTCSSRSSECICKSRIDERRFLFVPRKRSRNLFVWYLFCTECHLWRFFCEGI